MEIGTLVMVIVDRLDGCCEKTITKGEKGVITAVEKGDYEVHNHYGDFWYGADQIRELTDEECREALRNELMR